MGMRKNITIQKHGQNTDKCYVLTFQAPLSVYRAYHRGSYPEWDNDFAAGRYLRMGSYGDPAAIPLDVWEPMLARAKGWTGYTHQWRTRPDLAGTCMASVETEEEAILAVSMGWRYFRTTEEEESGKGEIVCPESRGLTDCATCGLCDGQGEIETVSVDPVKVPSGAVFYRGPSLLDGAPIVGIATGLKGSGNRKTGEMVQTWIMRADVEPHVAVKSGEDSSVCGECPLRRILS